jgi:hypothetical protein
MEMEDDHLTADDGENEEDDMVIDVGREKSTVKVEQKQIPEEPKRILTKTQIYYQCIGMDIDQLQLPNWLTPCSTDKCNSAIDHSHIIFVECPYTLPEQDVEVTLRTNMVRIENKRCKRLAIVVIPRRIRQRSQREMRWKLVTFNKLYARAAVENGKPVIDEGKVHIFYADSLDEFYTLNGYNAFSNEIYNHWLT